MITRGLLALTGGALGGVLPRLAFTATDQAAIPGWASIGISAVFGAAGALGVLYAFAVPRRECEITHHGVNNKIQVATLEAKAATAMGYATRAEFLEFRGETKGLAKKVDAIASHLGVVE